MRATRPRGRTTFDKVLIANRGEIAIRVIRACRELGVGTVAVYSEADADCLHVRYADEAVCIGPPPATRSYLVKPALIQAALQTGAQAIHPGYGFLAENAEFSGLCAQQGLKFIGPGPESIALMGDKASARTTMTAAGVPVTPGSKGVIADAVEAELVAKQIGLPVMVKAAAGGGGKGIRIVKDASEVAGAVRQAQAEAEAAFGDGSVYVEKYLEAPRHIEIQVLADGQGHGVHLGERDCSIQRRHQKLIEEAPSPAVDPLLRSEMGHAAVAAAVAAGYEGAGTVEFLLDPAGDFYFMEMNTRVQVEHCVTEMVSGVDIVKTGIRIAAGEGLPLRQEEVELEGHAIEFRINAEDPEAEFMPSPGTVTKWVAPGGPWVRLDSHVYQGYMVPPFYDSLLGKLVVWGRDREECVARSRWALDQFLVEGLPTTIPFHRRVLDHPFFIAGDVSTHFIEDHLG
ncbi:MAG TPA: acetyl-CoA carboxylase biotin carboxylase subunit [Thermoleophilia bacterium]|nr:acetyl-CoA carboxylase biotin carboxylase subunit [Thermoleophilia bacterium]